MNDRAVRILLWIALALAAPIPIFVAGSGAVPLVKLALLLGLSLAVLVFESTLGAIPLLSVVIGVQVLVHVCVLWLVAWLFTRFVPQPVVAAVIVAVAAYGGWAWSTSAYDDPYRAMPEAATTFPGQAQTPREDFAPATLHPAPLVEPGLPFERTEWREPCADHDVLRQPFWGDTHIHTSYSFDAWGQGTRNSPRDAYRFARGEPVGLQPYGPDGEPLRSAQLERPLDFTMLSDHSEMLGEVRTCQTPGMPGFDSFICTLARRWPLLGYIVINSQSMDEANPVRYGFCGPGARDCRVAARVSWQEIQEAAEEAYDRTSACRFTSFVGFEWSGNPDSNMIHRNVLFRNEDVPQRLSNYIDDRTQEKLWAWLDEACIAADGRCDALAIPHNSNLSNGALFPLLLPDGGELTREHAELRSRIEVLLEVTQHKGDSECRASAPGRPDELCDFETLPYARMREQATPWQRTEPPRMSYAREILGEGLVQHARMGANPFLLGLAGATDTHLGTPGLVSERDFPGHAAGLASSRLEVPPLVDDPMMNPGGLQAVWAEENSRDALFAAMRRRETYGTSGPRMVVRSFGGMDLPEDLCERGDFAARGYAHGVPMGGELVGAAAGATLSLAIYAQRDPGTERSPGTPLQRLQVVKIFEADGASHEQVIEVAGDPDNGARVDLRTCEPQGPGFDSLCTVWQDPAFDPDAHALYYVRVVENPTCRWSTWACNARGASCDDPETVQGALAACCDPDLPKTIQERAWTSPIWYTP
ncbi:MAG: DUF3604 domain-containing protein [Myxococcales bacterium]|nr:DUF3604 domain-containing protein [Myxococcales bacterium]